MVDRDTLVNVFDSEAALKEGAADPGFSLTSGGLSHKREFAHADRLENCQSDGRKASQSMFENFSEKLADGTLKAEPLSHVVSLFEEEQQDSKKPDRARQYDLQLDSKLTITTKRRHLSTDPVDEKVLRLKYAILTNLWLLAQMRQP